MSILTIIQVRVGSTRLPGKALLPIRGKPMFMHVVEAAPEPLIVACPATDWIIKDICRDAGVLFAYHHTSEDVLGRFVVAVQVATDYYQQEFSHVLRITADCPLLTQELILRFLATCKLLPDTIWTNRPLDPDGVDMELFPTWALLAADETADSPYDREHVTPAIYRSLKTEHVRVSSLDPLTKVSVDTRDEYLFIKSLMEGKVK